MSVKNHFVEVTIFIILIVWGAISAVQGMGYSFLLYGPNQYRDCYFIEALYFKVIVCALIATFSARIAALTSLGNGAILICIVLATKGLGHNAIVEKSLIWDIIWRPFVSALLLFFLPSVGPIGRLLLQKPKKSANQ